MFKITLYEKGGGEKELFFEGAEVTIGRIQGNNIILPKPNVSKRHAAIVYRDGRVTVVDLKSTNGTYVNGRRITTPREIGPDDRIYIGDYTLRVHLATPGTEPVIAPAPAQTISDEAERRPTLAMPAIPPMPPKDQLSGESLIELEVEPVSQESSELIPPLPSSTISETKVTPAKKEIQDAETIEKVSVDQAAERVHMEGKRFQMVESSHVLQVGETDDRYMKSLRRVSERAATEIFANIAPERTDFSDQEWSDLSDKVMKLVDLLRREDEVSADVDPYALTQDVLFEFAGLGPLEELFSDERIRTITVDGLDRLFVVRGSKTERVPRTFVSAATMDRVVTKLCLLAHVEPKGVVTEGRLPDGTRMTLLKPPLIPDGWVIVLERPRGSKLTLEDLVASGVMAEDYLVKLRELMARHANIVICGPRHSGKTILLNALLRLVPQGERVLVIDNRCEISLSQPDVINLCKERLLELEGDKGGLITTLSPDVVVLPNLTGKDIGLLTSLLVGGQKGVIATTTVYAPGEGAFHDCCLRGLELLAMHTHPFQDSETTRALFRKLLDAIVLLDVKADGKSYVLTVAEWMH